MNWKLIFQMSLFGLIMAFGTVSLIPERTEIIYWIVICVFCAFVIAKQCAEKQFLHGFWLSILNSVWITSVHVYFYRTYAAKHPDVASMGTNMHFLASHPRLLMLILCPIFGVAFGLLQGLFALIVSRFVKATPSTV